MQVAPGTVAGAPGAGSGSVSAGPWTRGSACWASGPFLGNGAWAGIRVHALIPVHGGCVTEGQAPLPLRARVAFSLEKEVEAADPWGLFERTWQRCPSPQAALKEQGSWVGWARVSAQGLVRGTRVCDFEQS